VTVFAAAVFPGENVMTIRGEPGTEQTPEEVEVLAQVRDAIRSLRYGQVTVVVHDGTVVQIDRLERRRVQRSGGSGRRE
jgi:hypothetical protein